MHTDPSDAPRAGARRICTPTRQTHLVLELVEARRGHGLAFGQPPARLLQLPPRHRLGEGQGLGHLVAAALGAGGGLGGAPLGGGPGAGLGVSTDGGLGGLGGGAEGGGEDLGEGCLGALEVRRRRGGAGAQLGKPQTLGLLPKRGEFEEGGVLKKKKSKRDRHGWVIMRRQCGSSHSYVFHS